MRPARGHARPRPPIRAHGAETAILGRARRTNVFPHNWLRGYADFSVAPPHNEPDLGRCSQSHAVIIAAGGASSNCNAYARYLLGGYLEVQPFGKTLARHLFVFFTPTFSFGNNVPQFKYTASMAGIAFERAVGFGIELPKNFEFRVTQHQVDWLGKYNHSVGLADLGTAGLRPTLLRRRALVLRRLRPRATLRAQPDRAAADADRWHLAIAPHSAIYKFRKFAGPAPVKKRPTE